MTASSSEPVDRSGDVAGELWASAVAAAAWSGAALAPPAALGPAVAALGGGLALVAFVRRSPVLLVIGALLVGAWSGARADAGFVPLEPGLRSGEATVIGDAEPRWPAWMVELRLPDGRRAQAVGYGSAADRISRARIGDRIRFTGRGRPVDTGWLRSRHVVGVLSVDEVERVGADGAVEWRMRRIGEAVRGRIVDGAEGLDVERRALYTGLVLGDDRFQSVGQRARFRQAGLTHLLAVSGQNVAFVLIVVGPVLRYLPVRARFVVTLAVLVLFAGITRYEPSVLRATATAGLAAWAALGGRHRTGIRILAIAVSVLVLVDPFLVEVTAFRLSVSASAGILVVGPVLARRLPGPRWLVDPLAVTLAAQIGVGPLLAAEFGPVSVATVPANLLAGWAAAVVMMLGLTLGIAAGFVPDAVATVVMEPIDWLLWWIDRVASWHARVPAPRIGLLSGLVVAVSVLMARSVERGGGAREGGSAPRIVAGRAGGVAMLVFVLFRAIPVAPTEPLDCGPGARYLPAVDRHPSVLILSGEAGERTVDGCVDVGVRSVDLALVTHGDHRANRVVGALGEVLEIGAIRAPPQHRVIGARRVLGPHTVETGWGALAVEPTADGRRLRVEPLSPRRR